MNTTFERSTNGKDEWLTPPEIVRALGEFDLDPCAPVVRPWATAKKHFTVEDDGLKLPWVGRVWLNPPYGKDTKKWLKKMYVHNQLGMCSGIALIFARVDTEAWRKYVWKAADAVLFLSGRITFYNADGTKAKQNAGAPSALVAYGEKEVEILNNCGLDGAFVDRFQFIEK